MLMIRDRIHIFVKALFVTQVCVRAGHMTVIVFHYYFKYYRLNIYTILTNLKKYLKTLSSSVLLCHICQCFSGLPGVWFYCRIGHRLHSCCGFLWSPLVSLKHYFIGEQSMIELVVVITVKVLTSGYCTQTICVIVYTATAVTVELKHDIASESCARWSVNACFWTIYPNFSW